MKTAMKYYFDLLITSWKSFNGTYPLTPYDEQLLPKIYVGEMNEEEYISWMPVEKDEISDFSLMEQEFGISIHESIKEYFNSYWFAYIKGFFNSCNIILDPVLPGQELDNFYAHLCGYHINHDHKIEYIPIGFDAVTNYLVVVGNTDGVVWLEDYERQM